MIRETLLVYHPSVSYACDTSGSTTFIAPVKYGKRWLRVSYVSESTIPGLKFVIGADD